jgi:hypothetical protein
MKFRIQLTVTFVMKILYHVNNGMNISFLEIFHAIAARCPEGEDHSPSVSASADRGRGARAAHYPAVHEFPFQRCFSISVENRPSCEVGERPSTSALSGEAVPRTLPNELRIAGDPSDVCAGMEKERAARAAAYQKLCFAADPAALVPLPAAKARPAVLHTRRQPRRPTVYQK